MASSERRGGDVFQRFTERSRRVVVLAQEECRLLHDVAIRSEHLLLALVAEDTSPLSDALRRAGVTAADLRAAVAGRHPRRMREKSGHIPFTDNLKRVLERAVGHADRATGDARDDVVSPSALVLGLLSVEECGAVVVLRSFGIDIDAVADAASAETARDGGAAVTRDDRDPGRPTHRPASREFARLAAAVRRYGRHDADCPGAAACVCGLQPILDDLPDDGNGPPA